MKLQKEVAETFLAELARDPRVFARQLHESFNDSSNADLQNVAAMMAIEKTLIGSDGRSFIHGVMVGWSLAVRQAEVDALNEGTTK